MPNKATLPPLVRLNDREKDQLDADVSTLLMGWRVDRDGSAWVLVKPGGEVAGRAVTGNPRAGEAADGDGRGGIYSTDGDGDGDAHGDGDGTPRLVDENGDGRTATAPRVAAARRPKPMAPIMRTVAGGPPPDFTGHYGKYSREMSYAATVVEAVTDAYRDRAAESPTDVLFTLQWLPGRWRATFTIPRQVSVDAETDAVAICVAALKAVGAR
ncbi:MAG: hypothetical protein JWO31_4096 [Phycisphaerales bacterium]|nr:hypothetical protein [Phycisphaerales bacterium]